MATGKSTQVLAHWQAVGTHKEAVAGVGQVVTDQALAEADHIRVDRLVAGGVGRDGAGHKGLQAVTAGGGNRNRNRMPGAASGPTRTLTQLQPAIPCVCDVCVLEGACTCA